MLRTFISGTSSSYRHGLNIIYCIILEPLQWLTRFYLRMVSFRRRLRRQRLGKPAPWVDLIDEELSPTTCVLQYYSWLAAGRASRLLLLYARQYTSFADWAAREPQLLGALRRGISVASSWVAERSHKPMMLPPWVWAKAIDQRHSEAKLDSLFEFFDHAPVEQIDETFSERLRTLLRLEYCLGGSALKTGYCHRVI